MTPVFTLFQNKYTKTSLIALTTFGVGISVGIFLYTNSIHIALNDNCPRDFTFVKAEQDCESFQNAIDKIQVIQDDLRRQVNGYLSTKRADRISVFLRDLDSQKFAYVNETEEFYMASLLKVPLAIAYFRLAELTPDILSQIISHDGKIDLSTYQEIKPYEKLAPGNHTVENLLYRALAYSDNTSAELLYRDFISYEYLQKILFTLGLPSKENDQSQNLVTARSYAGIFRTLYNSSFLSREYSNKILEDLSRSTFNEGATALLPTDVKVSHKFAERSFRNYQGQIIHQLHDCGIVYADKGNQPYSFCIMTEGKDFTNLKSVIQNVSDTIYKGIIE